MDNATSALAQMVALESFHQDKDAIASSFGKAAETYDKTCSVSTRRWTSVT